MNKVYVNGFVWYADISNRMLYEDLNKTSGTSFKFLTDNEIKQINDSIKYPRKS
jgi:hypothetical protein